MRRLLLLALAGALALAPGAATAADSGGLGITSVDTSEHPEVTLRVSAPRELVGESVPAEAFSLSEAGQTRDISVEQVRGDELEVVLVLDTSGSMGIAAMEAAKAGAAGVLDQLPPGTRVAVVEFNTGAHVVSPLSTDAEAHRSAIEALQADGNTALYDGIAASIEQFSDQGAQRAVVVLSDGGDTSSATTLNDVTALVTQSGASLHAVELSTYSTEPEILSALAAAGNGRHIATHDPDSLAAIYAAVARELRDSYVLTYTSEAQGRVELRVAVNHAGGQATVSQRVSMPAPPLVPFAPGIFASPLTLAAGAVLLFVAMFLLLFTALWPGQVRSLLSGKRGGGLSGRSVPGISTLANRATLVVEHTLQRRGWTPSLNGALERAGIPLRPGEYVVLALSAGLVAFAAGLLLSGLLLALALACLVALASVFGLRLLGSRRRDAFTDQLGETLQLMAGTLRAGYGLLQAIDAVAREAESPTAEEFRRIVVETRLGRDLEEALHAMERRVGSEDLTWIVQAIAIHQDVGGDLAEVLDTVAGTIRERNQIRRQVKALSAEGKLSAIVLYVLPFAVAGFVTLSNPSYLSVLVTEPIGWAMLGVGGGLMAIGGLWLRKVVRISF